MIRLVDPGVKITRLIPILALFLAMAWPIVLAGQEAPKEASAILVPLTGIVPINRTMSLPGQGRAEKIAFSPDGTLLAISGGKNALVWNYSTGFTKILTVPTKSPVLFCTFDFSPDGETLATVMGREKIVIWDLKNYTSRVLDGASSSLNASYSPDGKCLVIAANVGGLELWDVLTGKKIKTFLKKKSSTYGRVVFSPDGKQIAVSDESKRIVLVEAGSGKIVRSFSGHQDLITDFVISQDGKLLASGGSDKRIIIWDMSSGEKIKDIHPLPDRVNDVDISPDGRLIAAALGPQIFPWEKPKAETSVLILDLRSNEGRTLRIPFCYSLAFSPDGKILATGISSGEEVAILWDISPYGIADKFRKDPFETTAEYQARVGQVEIPYAETVILNAGQYNADRGGFEIQFKKNKLFIAVDKEAARELVERKGGTLRLTGRLKYHDLENLRLEEAVLEDTITGKKLPVVKVGEVSPESK